MANAQLGPVLRHIRKIAPGQTTRELTDRELLHAFTQDAEDAFQANSPEKLSGLPRRRQL